MGMRGQGSWGFQSPPLPISILLNGFSRPSRTWPDLSLQPCIWLLPPCILYSNGFFTSEPLGKPFKSPQAAANESTLYNY